MTEEGTKRLKLGLRENRGRLIKESWLDELSRVCKVTITLRDLLGLKETEQLKVAFFEKVKSGSVKRMFWDGDQSVQILNTLRLIEDKFSTEIILFSHLDYYVGAVKILSDHVLEHPLDVWGVVQNDLALATTSLEDGLCLELNSYGRQKTEYELTTWGQFSPDDANSGARLHSQYL